jgi:hypothetical protein
MITVQKKTRNKDAITEHIHNVNRVYTEHGLREHSSAYQ